MPEIIEVEDFKTLPADVPVGTIVVRTDSLGGKSALRRTDRTRSWKSVDVETVSIDSAPYRDTTETYHVTFSGGTPSNTLGWELPFAIYLPRSKRLDEHVVWASDSPEQRDREHAQRIRDRVRVILGYATDTVGGEERSMGSYYLKSFDLVECGYFHTTYRFVVVKPNLS